MGYVETLRLNTMENLAAKQPQRRLNVQRLSKTINVTLIKRIR